MKPKITTTVLIGTLLLGTLFTGNVHAEAIQEKITVTPGRTITPREESTISSAALKVLRHIAQARGDIHSKNLSGAQAELKQAQKLIEVIKATLPTEKIKDRIWVAKKHLTYEDTDTVMQDLIPIYASVDDIEEFAPMNNVKEHVDKAKKHLQNGNKKGANEELKLADDAVVFTEIDLPLGYTEKKISSAQKFLAKKEAKKADISLKSAEDGVQYLSIMDTSPVYQARKSFWRATKNYLAGKTDAARADIKDAKAYLAKVDRTVDAKTNTEIDNLLKDTETIEAKLDKFDHETGQKMKKLYERFKTLTIGFVTAIP